MTMRRSYLIVSLLAAILFAAAPAAEAMWLMKWKDTIEGAHQAVRVELVRPTSLAALAQNSGPGELVVRLPAPLAKFPTLERAAQSHTPLAAISLRDETPSAGGTYLKFELEKVSIVSIEFHGIGDDPGTGRTLSLKFTQARAGGVDGLNSEVQVIEAPARPAAPAAGGRAALGGFQKGDVLSLNIPGLGSPGARELWTQVRLGSSIPAQAAGGGAPGPGRAELSAVHSQDPAWTQHLQPFLLTAKQQGRRIDEIRLRGRDGKTLALKQVSVVSVSATGAEVSHNNWIVLQSAN